jgi:hypothetical protein
MKVFRVHLTDSSGMSLGFEYYSNKKDAQESLRNNAKNKEDVRVDNDSIEMKEIVIGKYEILDILNDWGSHPDNG